MGGKEEEEGEEVRGRGGHFTEGAREGINTVGKTSTCMGVKSSSLTDTFSDLSLPSSLPLSCTLLVAAEHIPFTLSLT